MYAYFCTQAFTLYTYEHMIIYTSWQLVCTFDPCDVKLNWKQQLKTYLHKHAHVYILTGIRETEKKTMSIQIKSITFSFFFILLHHIPDVHTKSLQSSSLYPTRVYIIIIIQLTSKGLLLGLLSLFRCCSEFFSTIYSTSTPTVPI